MLGCCGSMELDHKIGCFVGIKTLCADVVIFVCYVSLYLYTLVEWVNYIL